jgi:hypothetical protein
MRARELFRLAAIGLLFILLQLALYLRFPEWRSGMDFYLVFLLLLTATRGQLAAGAFALSGGIIMDSFSSSFIAFHVFFYLIPVAAGSMMRTHVLVHYRLLGTLTVAVLLLIKILSSYAVAQILHWLGSPVYLLRVNYFSPLLVITAVYLGWPQLVRIFTTIREVKGFGR